MKASIPLKIINSFLGLVSLCLETFFSFIQYEAKPPTPTLVARKIKC
jgi:hypothetical protein